MIFCRWHLVLNKGVKVKVQGLGELFVAEKLNTYNIDWERPKSFSTNFGKYTPDFYCKKSDTYIEVKGFRTALAMIGSLSLLERGERDWAKEVSNKSLKKMLDFKASNKKLIIYINDNKNDKKYINYKNLLIEKLKDFDVIYSKDRFIKFIESKNI